MSKVMKPKPLPFSVVQVVAVRGYADLGITHGTDITKIPQIKNHLLTLINGNERNVVRGLLFENAPDRWVEFMD